MENTPETKPKSNKIKIIVTIIILLGLTYGIMRYLHSQSHETTDDAQVQKNMNPIFQKFRDI